MMDLQLINENDVWYTDSREVAEMVGKQHYHLLRDIDSYVNVLAESNFGLSDFFISDSYVDSTGRALRCYLITKKAVT